MALQEIPSFWFERASSDILFILKLFLPTFPLFSFSNRATPYAFKQMTASCYHREMSSTESTSARAKHIACLGHSSSHLLLVARVCKHSKCLSHQSAERAFNGGSSVDTEPSKRQEETDQIKSATTRGETTRKTKPWNYYTQGSTLTHTATTGSAWARRRNKQNQWSPGKEHVRAPIKKAGVIGTENSLPTDVHPAYKSQKRSISGGKDRAWPWGPMLPLLCEKQPNPRQGADLTGNTRDCLQENCHGKPQKIQK